MFGFASIYGPVDQRPSAQLGRIAGSRPSLLRSEQEL
jgi:hypothetical protein